MQRKDLALRVLSTAAIMSIVTSIAAPAFAGTYYMENGDLSIRQDEYGKVWVKSGNSKELEDTDDEVIICGGAGDNKWSNGSSGGAALTSGTPAAEEQQPDPNAGSTLNETEEGSAQTKEGSAQTKEGSAQTKEGSAQTEEGSAQTKEGSAQTKEGSAQTEEGSAQTEEDSAQTRKAALAPAPAADPAPTTPAAGSATTSTTNVINVVNNWVGKAAKELKIRLSNVNIKVGDAVDKAAMDVSGGGTTKVELDGQNVLDGSESWYQAGLRKQGEGTLIITDETDDTGKKITTPKSESDNSGSLIAKGAGSNGAAGIGGKNGESTKNIIIEGYATVDATGGGNGAGIGGGGGTSRGVSGDAENIIIQGHSKVTASARNGAAIGGGSAFGSGNSYFGGSAKGIVIRDHATVVAKGTGTIGSDGDGAAIGAAGYSGNHTEAEVTIGTAGATEAEEDVHITATGLYGSAIGNGEVNTKVTIQGHVTIQTASGKNDVAIGSKNGNVEVNIKDNVTVDTDDATFNVPRSDGGSGIGGGYDYSGSGRKVEVTIDGGDNGRIEIGKKSAITGAYGAISGTKVKIGDNVLLKMNPRNWGGPYIKVNNTEAEVGTRSDAPGAVGLVNTIGDNTELWYYSTGRLQKIVHGKNICKKGSTQDITKQPTCTEPGSANYTCNYENGAAHPSCNRTWTGEVSPLGHDYQKTSTVAPTCGAQGYDVYTCTHDSSHTEKRNYKPALGHDWKDNGEANHICDRDHVTAAHSYGEWTTVKEATCTAAGQKQHTCTECGHVETQEIPATGHHWVDNGNGTHTCTKCGATEALPANTNSALELRVVDAEGMNQPFTVSQNGTLRTYTGAYDTATLTGDLDTLRYLQDHGAQTIQFVTNGQTSSFDINDLLAQGSGSEVFYLTHRGTEEPTLLLVEADHSDLVKD